MNLRDRLIKKGKQTATKIARKFEQLKSELESAADEGATEYQTGYLEDQVIKLLRDEKLGVRTIDDRDGIYNIITWPEEVDAAAYYDK